MPAPSATHSAPPDAFRLSELLSALSFALDLTEGQVLGHSARTCAIGMRFAKELELGDEERSDLFYALLLKDAGCSSNASRLAALFASDDQSLKHHHKLIDWTRIDDAAGYAIKHTAPNAPWLERLRQIAAIAMSAKEIGREMIAMRCARGADIVRMMGMSRGTAEAIQHLDEHWNGAGHPLGLSKQGIPLLGRILCLAQTMEVYATAFGVEAASTVIRQRRGRWFDPELADLALQLTGDDDFWNRVASDDPRHLATEWEPAERIMEADDRKVDQVAEGFAAVIDAKSPYTYHHSTGVAAIAVELGDELGLSLVDLHELRRAALLHDIGKLGVSSAILDKPGRLTDDERTAIKLHPKHTYDILIRVERFRSLAWDAAAHHERLDGQGYHLGVTGDQLSQRARILAVADICEALQATRPYRSGLPWEKVMEIMTPMAGTAICPEVFEALQGRRTTIDSRLPASSTEPTS